MSDNGMWTIRCHPAQSSQFKRENKDNSSTKQHTFNKLKETQEMKWLCPSLLKLWKHMHGEAGITLLLGLLDQRQGLFPLCPLFSMLPIIVSFYEHNNKEQRFYCKIAPCQGKVENLLIQTPKPCAEARGIHATKQRALKQTGVRHSVRSHWIIQSVSRYQWSVHKVATSHESPWVRV